MHSRSNWNLEVLVFKERGGIGVPGEKPLRASERTNNKLNPHMALTPGFKPGSHCWEASYHHCATLTDRLSFICPLEHKNIALFVPKAKCTVTIIL